MQLIHVRTFDRKKRVDLVARLGFKPLSKLISNRLCASAGMSALHLTRLLEEDINPILCNLILCSSCSLHILDWFLDTVASQVQLSD